MSYFSMAIITKGKPTEEMIEKIMAPYQNVGVGSFPPAEYRKFIADPNGCWDEEEQKCGYWENPNGKWSGWLLGVCSGLIRVNKKTAVGYDFVCKDKGRECGDIISCDSARVKDIIRNDEKEVERLKRQWEIIVEHAEPQNKVEEIIERYGGYRVAAEKLAEYGTKEKYAERVSSVLTGGFITKDGKWYDLSEMQGLTRADKKREYEKAYNVLVFDNAADDDYLTVIYAYD